MDAFLNEMLGGEGNKEAKARFRSLWDVSSNRVTGPDRADDAGV
jgi:putative hydrolase of HD superfamily